MKMKMKEKKSIRVVVPNVVYLTNLPPSLNEELLLLPEFLGMYGALEKVVVHKNRSAHIVYKSPESADLCRTYLHHFEYDGAIISALEGTTKYAEDVNLKNLRIASYKEPIRPVPKYPVFPMPRRFTHSRPIPVDACFVGTGTLVNKAWHPLTDNKLSPGSIDTFKSCFVPKFNFTDLSTINNDKDNYSDYNHRSEHRSSPFPNHNDFRMNNSNHHRNNSNGFEQNQTMNNNNNNNQSYYSINNSKKSDFNSTSGSTSTTSSYDTDEDDDKTPRGVADLGDDLSVTTIDSGSKSISCSLPPGLNPSAPVYHANYMSISSQNLSLKENHMNLQQHSSGWRNAVVANLN
jgi:hypothetical protein